MKIALTLAAGALIALGVLAANLTTRPPSDGRVTAAVRIAAVVASDSAAHRCDAWGHTH
jgi:hypothetical protein